MGLYVTENIRTDEAKVKLNEKKKFNMMMIRVQFLSPSYVTGHIDNNYSERYAKY